MCNHKNFFVKANVNRLEDVEKFHLDITIVCEDCKEPFRFIGLPTGIDLNSPTVSVDGLEGRFPIAPKSESLSFLDGVSFTINRTF